MVRSLGQEDPLEKEMAAHSSILAWETLRMEEPGGPWSMAIPEESAVIEHAHTHAWSQSTGFLLYKMGKQYPVIFAIGFIS